MEHPVNLLHRKRISVDLKDSTNFTKYIIGTWKLGLFISYCNNIWVQGAQNQNYVQVISKYGTNQECDRERTNSSSLSHTSNAAALS